MATAHLAVYDTLADWEPGYLLAELRTGRFTGTPFDIVAVSETGAPVTTMGGLRVTPDAAAADLDPAVSDLLILPGAALYDAGEGQLWADAAARFLAADVPVAAICGATFGLARAGILDDRPHTSAALQYLQMTDGYAGGDHYVDARAVAFGGLITAGPDSPIQWATATLATLGLIDGNLQNAYERLFGEGDASAFPVLQAAQQS
ncbi:MAG: DJ-1/PfpI family protein [Solirubrobacteraceae bacterium]|nr:DJ-1/PfpI family protein [Solirubrobacteraceae bacterium]